jgi:hypothetical protein
MDFILQCTRFKDKATALTLAGKTAKDIIDVVTNNKPLADEAFKFASASASSSDDYEKDHQNKIKNKKRETTT